MYEDRAVQPRQIYASTVTRRDRRWTRRRGRPTLAVALLSTAMVLAAVSVLAALAPGVT
jgi:hypothetical protein